MLIFLPISQFGCFRASFLVTLINSSLFLPLKGPPEAVNIIFSISLCLSPFKHWNMALCSLSTGNILTLFFLASDITNSPAVTKVSLLANAIVFFAFIAAIVGTRPIIPTTAVNTTSTSSSSQILTKPSIEVNTSIFILSGIMSFNFLALSSLYTVTYLGENSNICSNNKSTLLFAEIATTSNLSLFFLTTSKV